MIVYGVDPQERAAIVTRFVSRRRFRGPDDSLIENRADVLSADVIQTDMLCFNDSPFFANDAKRSLIQVCDLFATDEVRDDPRRVDSED